MEKEKQDLEIESIIQVGWSRKVELILIMLHDVCASSAVCCAACPRVGDPQKGDGGEGEEETERGANGFGETAERS